MPLILGTNSIKDTGYNIDNSCRFNAADSAYLTRTFGSAGNRQKWTFSTWCKRAKFGAQQTLFGSSADGSNYHLFYWGSDETLTHNFSGTTTSASGLFRDPSAWYHVVCAVDTTQGTAANRVRLYVNGAEVGSGSYPDEDAEMILNNNVRCDVGSSGAHFTSHMLGGYLAETVFIDGTQYAASDFGEFSEDSPTIWMPKDVSGLTFGTNGFWFDYKASGTLGNDANGGTDWTATNLAAADQATDVPTNNFCTLNPLEAVTATTTYAEGNTQGTTSNAARATFAVSNGKWYWEHKFVNKEAMGGVMAYNGFLPNAYTINALIQGSNPELVLNGTEQSSWSGDGTPDAMVDNDILNVALDCDNNRIAFGVNGAYLNATDGSGEWSGTTLNYYSISDGYDYAPAFRTGSGTNRVSHMNFGGCPGFAISSGNADANGYGNFEYAVPSGFFSLCSKNLAQYG